MKPRTERNLAAALSLALLLPAAVRAQAQDAPVSAVAASKNASLAAPAPAKTPDAVPAASQNAAAASPPSSKMEQGKDQLTRMPSAADFKPNGPVTIGANKAELVQGNAATYTGNVTLDSDTLKMDGDRLELKRSADGQYTAKVTGAPAHMSHAGNGPDNPPVSARARTMTYDSRNGVIDLVGEALLTRGNDKTTAETIRYHVLEQRYEASGGDSGNGRVTIVIPQVNAAGGTPAAVTPAAGNPQPAAAVSPATAPANTAPPQGNPTPGSAAPAKPQPAAPPPSPQTNGPKP